MCSFLSLPGELLDDEGEVEEFDPPDDWGDICVIADIAPNDEDIPEVLRFGDKHHTGYYGINQVIGSWCHFKDYEEKERKLSLTFNV